MIMEFAVPEPVEVPDVLWSMGRGGRNGGGTRGRARPISGPLGRAHAQAARQGARGSPWGDRDLAGPACVLATQGTHRRAGLAVNQATTPDPQAIETIPVIGPVVRTVRRIVTGDRAESKAFIRDMDAAQEVDE